MIFEHVIGWTRALPARRPLWMGFFEWYDRPRTAPRAINVLPAF